jgi:hypothetical protein
MQTTAEGEEVERAVREGQRLRRGTHVADAVVLEGQFKHGRRGVAADNLLGELRQDAGGRPGATRDIQCLCRLEASWQAGAEVIGDERVIKGATRRIHPCGVPVGERIHAPVFLPRLMTSLRSKPSRS